MRRKRKKTLEEKVNIFLILLIFLCVLPVFLTTFMGRLRIEDLLINRPGSKIAEVEAKLPLIVAKEISIQMPEECIKAQSVIARTNLMAAREAGEEEPQGFEVEELQTLWGSEYAACYEKLPALIKETEGETLQYKDKYIYAAYHQTSAGNTRDMGEYYKSNVMPYLSSAACHEDTTAEGYLNVFFWTEEDFLKQMKLLFSEEELQNSSDVTITARDSAGYVLEVLVGQTVYDGETFRKRLNLPSACLELTLLDGDVRIVTLGQGHGFGLSQSMAKHLAEAGYSYKEILTYFYKGVTIKE